MDLSQNSATGEHSAILPRRASLALVILLATISSPQPGFSWGREGHEVIALVAERYMMELAKTTASELLDGRSIESISNWADDYRREHRETGPWHYINCPLADPKIDMSRDCPHGDCVVVKTEQFLAVLRDQAASRGAKAEALKYVVHFIGDLHQPLRDEDNGDKGGNEKHVVFDGHPDNLHWVWDVGLLQHSGRNPRALAAELEGRITTQERSEWETGNILDWANEAHQIARAVAYGDLGGGSPASIAPDYERQVDPVVELQLERAGVRLAWLLNGALK
jgi:hypothetical protein